MFFVENSGFDKWRNRAIVKMCHSQPERSLVMDFRALNTVEKEKLMNALRGNAENNRAMLMSKDTSFLGSADDVTDEEVINAVKSVPCHY